MIASVKAKLAGQSGNILVSAAVILLVFSMLLTACLEVVHVWTVSDVAREQTKEAVLAVAAINVENVYNGVRESVGQARAVDAAGTTWSNPVSSEEVMDILVANMGMFREDDTLTKYTDAGAEIEFIMNNLQIGYDNAESGLHFTITFQLEIPMRIGKDVLPSIRVSMKVDLTYEAKF